MHPFAASTCRCPDLLAALDCPRPGPRAVLARSRGSQSVLPRARACAQSVLGRSRKPAPAIDHHARILTVLVAVIAMCPASRLHAQIYKCTGQGDIPVYQGTPCPPGRELRNFAADPAPVSVLPMPPLPSTGNAAAGSAARSGASSPASAPTARARSTPRAERSRGGDPAQRRYLFAGMQAGEVLARAGAPDMKAGGSKSARWTYLPHPGDPQTLTTVVIEEGRVVDVERKVVR